MSEDLEIGEDPIMMKMEEDGEASSEEQMPTTAEVHGLGGESEGSKIDASRNEEDEG